MKDLDVTLLQRLLEASPDHVSGVSLAKEVGLSRVSVWKHLEGLQKEGFKFEAIRNKGYRILQEPPFVHPALLRAYMKLKGKGVPSIFYFETIDSTNSEALRMLADGSEAPFLVLAKTQSEGRGRLGRKWAATDTGNAYMTYGFRPDVPASQMQSFTIWMGASLCHFLNDLGYPIGIKWPNDFVHDGKKLGGMLTEAQLDTDCMRSLALGIGININTNFNLIPEDFRDRVTSLAQVNGKKLSMNAFVAAFVRACFDAYETYMSGEYKELLHDYWKCYDVLRGKAVALIQRDKRIAGRVEGIDEQGHLLLMDEKSGTISSFYSGDVTIEKK